MGSLLQDAQNAKQLIATKLKKIDETEMQQKKAA